MPKNGLPSTSNSLAILKTLRGCFLKYLWGRTQQRNILTSIWNVKYETSFGPTKGKYATNKYFKLQQLGSLIDEEIIIKQLSHHFDTSVTERDNVRIYEGLDKYTRTLIYWTL